MKIHKSWLRTAVTDGHLDAVMCIAISSWKQNFSTLVHWKHVQRGVSLPQTNFLSMFRKCKHLFVVLCNKEVRSERPIHL